MSAETSTDDLTVDRPRTPFWLALTFAVLFGLFFAYDVFEALGNLLGMSAFANSVDSSITVTGWVLLVVAMVLPLVLFVIAFTLGHRRAPLAQVGLYLVALGVSAVLSLDIIAAVARWIPIA